MKTIEQIEAAIEEIEKVLPIMQQNLMQLQSGIHANMGALEAYRNVLKDAPDAPKTPCL